jgi:hypothetical protein
MAAIQALLQHTGGTLGDAPTAVRLAARAGNKTCKEPLP